MDALPHPEVLAPEWTPPTLVARAAPLAALREQLKTDRSPAETTPVVLVRGPPGSGTSAVARRAALELIERMRRTPSAAPPLFAPVRVPWATGPRGIASELLQRLDPEHLPRGFPVAEILAGFLRRLARTGRPAIVLLDDLRTDSADIGPIVRALRAPDRFLPEGEERAARIWLLLAGDDRVSACWDRAFRAGLPREPCVVLGEYRREDVVAIVRDRARRALGRDPPDGWAERIGGRAFDSGPGARRAIALLHRELTGPTPPPRPVPGRPAAPFSVEARLLEALKRTASGGPTFLHSVREWEARLARDEGVRPLPATTLWRRIVRLEAAGIVRRAVRTGGNGGTQSTVELVGPIAGGFPFTVRPSTPRAGGAPFAASLPLLR